MCSTSQQSRLRAGGKAVTWGYQQLRVTAITPCLSGAAFSFQAGSVGCCAAARRSRNASATVLWNDRLIAAAAALPRSFGSIRSE